MPKNNKNNKLAQTEQFNAEFAQEQNAKANKAGAAAQATEKPNK